MRHYLYAVIAYFCKQTNKQFLIPHASNSVYVTKPNDS